MVDLGISSNPSPLPIIPPHSLRTHTCRCVFLLRVGQRKPPAYICSSVARNGFGIQGVELEFVYSCRCFTSWNPFKLILSNGAQSWITQMATLLLSDMKLVQFLIKIMVTGTSRDLHLLRCRIRNLYFSQSIVESYLMKTIEKGNGSLVFVSGHNDSGGISCSCMWQARDAFVIKYILIVMIRSRS